MSEKKDINRFFQERFKDFEAAPPAALWDQIEKELPAKKKRHRAGWIFYGGIAAGIALLLSLVYFANFNESATVDQHIVNQKDSTTVDTLRNNTSNSSTNPGNANEVDSQVTQTTPTESNENFKTAPSYLKLENAKNINTSSKESVFNHSTDISGVEDHSSQENRSEISSNAARTKTNNLKQKNNKLRSNSVQNNLSINKTAVAVAKNDAAQDNIHDPLEQRDDENPRDASLPKDAFENTPNASEIAVNRSIETLNQPVDSTTVNKLVEDAVAQQELEKKGDSLSGKAINGNRFQGSTMIAPIYSNASGSSLNNTVANNERSAGYNLSYGVAVGYELNDRWVVRAGLHKVDVSYNTQDIRYGATLPSATVAGNFNQDGITSAVVPTNTAVAGAFPELINNSFKGFDGELTQQLGYIEMPLEIRYNITNSKLKLSLTGGFSALFLQENNVRITDNNQRLELGSDDNFRDFNQSANFGIGLDYGITDKLGIMLEPMFKYQLNALERNTANFRPYTIGMYSGLTFKF